MDKQKQIEEMARDFGNAQYRCNEDSPCCKECILNGDCIPYEYARVAYNAGYRKIPEGAVILTKAEYESKRLLATECLRWRLKYGNMNAITEESKE